jgi:hypothetical protein
MHRCFIASVHKHLLPLHLHGGVVLLAGCTTKRWTFPLPAQFWTDMTAAPEVQALARQVLQDHRPQSECSRQEPLATSLHFERSSAALNYSARPKLL